MRNILISGGSRGIGEAIVEKMLTQDNRISLGIRDLSRYKRTIEQKYGNIPEHIFLNEYNAANEHSAYNWVKKAEKDFGGNIDTLIISAGIFKDTGFLYQNENEIKELLQVNLMGPWYLMKAAWQNLMKSRKGRIIVLSSMSGKRSKSSFAGYTASKFALMGLCETVRNEGWSYGIRISTICPGWVNTQMAKNIDSIPKGDMTQPADIAEICSCLLNLPNSSVPFEVKLNCNLEK